MPGYARSLAPLQIPALCCFALWLGCAPGAGCGALQPLPGLPRPSGFPAEQLIEGGLQARLTRPGFDKLTSLIPPLIKDQLAQPFCIPPAEQDLAGIANIKECTDRCGTGNGCPVTIKLPANGVQFTLPDGANPVLNLAATFDVSAPVKVKISLFGGGLAEPTFQVTATSTKLSGGVRLLTDPKDGQLALKLDALRLDQFDLRIGGCGFVQPICSAISGYVSGLAQNYIRDFIINTLTPQLDALLQGFLPKPAGVAGIIDLGGPLASLVAPSSAALEAVVLAGGYVSAYAGGLNLGVISGLNSDADRRTRGPGQTADPALCVPARSAPILGAPPYSLPHAPGRDSFALGIAAEFSGLPDPRDDMGQVQDLALGVSRTFLDLLGFHLYNAGTLCLTVKSDAIPQLNAGTLSLLAPSLRNLLDERGGPAPVALSLRPQEPIRFRIGAAPAALLNAQVHDLRIDLYVWIEERFVRLFTLSLDLDVGLDLSPTMVDGAVALAPVLRGIDQTNLKVRLLNSDLLAESATQLEKVFPTLISVAVDALTGSLKPLPLPAVQGFSLERLRLGRVQSSKDEFLAIYAGLHLGTLTLAGPVHGEAQLADLTVPPAAAQRAALMAGQGGPLPEGVTTLRLRASVRGEEGPVAAEVSYQIDGGLQRPWVPLGRDGGLLTVREPALLLHGAHTITVRSRRPGEARSEDPQPQVLRVEVPAAVEEPAAVASGCQVGGPGGAATPAGLLWIGALVLLARRRARWAGLLWALLSGGCAAEPPPGCKVDEDCRRAPAALSCDSGTIAVCMGQAGCACSSDLPLGDIGRFSSLAYGAQVAHVSAYNNSYGDLMLGHVRPPGEVVQWDFVDGVPAVAPDLPSSAVRGGVSEPGDDVGRYSSLALDLAGQPIIAYYDATARALRLARFGLLRYRSVVLDSGAGDDIGRYAALSVGRDGTLEIAYLALVQRGADGKPASQLRVLRSRTADPQGPEDFTRTVVDSLPWTPPDPKAPPPLAMGVALFIAAARRPDDGLALAYHDQVHGGLRFCERQGEAWKAPRTLAGTAAGGGEAGLYPGLAVDAQGTAHVSFVSAARGELRYLNTRTAAEEVIDDGLRTDERTGDGRPSPVHHLVGDGSALAIVDGHLLVAYQDATAGELRLARRELGAWQHRALAGPDGRPGQFRGSYGFYAALRAGEPGQVVISSYAINQKADPARFFVETFVVGL